MDLEPEEKKSFKERERERYCPLYTSIVQYGGFQFFCFLFFVSLDCLLLSCSDSMTRYYGIVVYFVGYGICRQEFVLFCGGGLAIGEL